MDPERVHATRELLRDVGWFPSDLACEEKKRLAEEYLEATTLWHETGERVSQKFLECLRQGRRTPSSLLLAKKELEASLPAIDESRRKAARARIALETHIASHHC